MKRLSSLSALLLVALHLAMPHVAGAQSSDQPVVQVVYFHTPVCPACERVLSGLLEPMMDEYGQQLRILKVNTLEDAGYEVFLSLAEQHQIPSERQGVPTIVVGDTVLIGSSEITERFRPLVEDSLAAGGIDWPDIPGLSQRISEFQTSASDRLGLALVGVVLAIMVVVLGYIVWRARVRSSKQSKRRSR
jgi:hypothetical protein